MPSPDGRKVVEHWWMQVVRAETRVAHGGRVRHLLCGLVFLTIAIAPAAAVAAGGLCPGLPPRPTMPLEATAAEVPIPTWRQRSDQLTRDVAGRNLQAVKAVFVGDSITQSWDPTMWNLFWGAYTPLNLGLWGDLTQGVLWRLNNGQWPAALKPDIAVILIGTNNASWHSRAEDTALGIAEIIRFIHSRSPATRILLLGILPRGPDNATPERPISAHVNGLVRTCIDNQTVFYAEPGRSMIDEAGRIPKDVMFDFLHLTMVGYGILGGSIQRDVRQITGR